jgi:hypothetical protein
MSDIITHPPSTTLHHTPPHSTTLHHTPPHSTTLHHTPPQKSGPNGLYITTWVTGHMARLTH